MKRLVIATAFIALSGVGAYASAPTCDNNGRCVQMGSQASTSHSVARHATKARTHHRKAERVEVDPNGNVVSKATGASARVGAAYAARFQAYIDDLEHNHGARVIFMGGIRKGHCSSGSLHPCGRALDICQRRRGVVDRRCNLPGRAELARIAAAHGLFEGGQWCHSDYGHAQVGETAGACGSRLASRRTSTTLSAH